MTITFTIQRRFVGPNIREHHMARKRRVESERAGVVGTMLVELGPDWRRRLGPAPYVVTLTRIGPRAMDDDNIQGACKAIRDQVAVELGYDDSPRSPIAWRYAPQRRGEYGVEVQIESVAEQRSAG